MTAITLTLALLPPLLLLWYFYSRDVYREPRRVVLITFLLGVGCALPAIVLELPVWYLSGAVRSDLGAGLTMAFVGAAIPEECLKFLVLYLYCYRNREFDEPMDGMVYGAVASLGFATIENVLYCLHVGPGLAILRAVTAVPAHAFFGALMGYYMGQAKFTVGRRPRLFLYSLGIPVVLHGLYDFPALTMMKAVAGGVTELNAEIVFLLIGLVVFSLGSLVVAWIWSIKLVHRLRKLQLELKTQELSGSPLDVLAVETPAQIPP